MCSSLCMYDYCDGSYKVSTFLLVNIKRVVTIHVIATVVTVPRDIDLIEFYIF